jgi:8-oxo-dGTP pyrophosphatase MutT (NUDIX family)
MVNQRKLEWEIIEQKQLFKDKWIDVKQETCIKPDGSLITPFYTYAFPDFATALAFTKEGKVILERIYRHGVQLTAPEIPGGCVDASDENVTNAMARELLEETGYRFEEIIYLGKIAHNPSIHNNYMHMFVATGGVFDATVTLDANEDVDVFTVTIEEFLHLLHNNTFLQAMQVCTIYKALQHLGYLTIKL